MIIGGLEKFSLIDYPEHLSAIVFTQGCNFRCHFCYNPMLVVSPVPKPATRGLNSGTEDDKLQNSRFARFSEKSYPSVTEDSLFLFLESRRGKLDGIVISGGEPTLQPDLPEFIKKIKDLGFKVKLDTNGTNPAMLERLLEEGLIDYIAMDIKAPAQKYEKVVSASADIESIKKSISLIMTSGLPYEFRTTLVPGLHESLDIEPMAQLISGAEKWYLQIFQGSTPLVNNNYLENAPFSEKMMEEMVEIAKPYVRYCAYR
jgi:pyruvate formate lyase activating enzyme